MAPGANRPARDRRCALVGVELHGAHGYLLDSFLRAGRIEYVCDLVREMRRQVGPDYPLAIRFSQWTVRDLEARQFDTPGELEHVQFCGDGSESAVELTRRYELGEFDMVAIGRPLLSDAQWCNKVRDDRTDEIVDHTPEANKIYP
jgi:pentatricopeptide repeat protein